MNSSFPMMSVMMRRTAMTLAAAGGLLGTSCTMFVPSYDPTAPGFTPDGRPRYGYHGTNSPNYGDPQAPPSGPRGTVREIKRDPRNTDVDLTPPAQRGSTPPEVSPGNPSPPENASHPTTPADAPPVKKAPREDLPYGTPVVGKPGYVYSPYAEDRQVDVRDLKRGTRVHCPYTPGKDFRVP